MYYYRIYVCRFVEALLKNYAKYDNRNVGTSICMQQSKKVVCSVCEPVRKQTSKGVYPQDEAARASK